MICQKNQTSRRIELQLAFSVDKLSLLTGRTLAAYLLFEKKLNSRHFFKLCAWRPLKVRACLLRFSALKLLGACNVIQNGDQDGNLVPRPSRERALGRRFPNLAATLDFTPN